MRHQRNKGGAYVAGIGLLGLLVTGGIMIWLFSDMASVSVDSYKSSKDALDAIDKSSAQQAEEAYQRNRDPSGPATGNLNKALESAEKLSEEMRQRHRDGGASGDIGVAPVSPATPVIVTPPVTAPQPNVTPVKRITNQVPRQIHSPAEKMLEE